MTDKMYKSTINNHSGFLMVAISIYSKNPRHLTLTLTFKSTNNS